MTLPSWDDITVGVRLTKREAMSAAKALRRQARRLQRDREARPFVPPFEGARDMTAQIIETLRSAADKLAEAGSDE